MFFKFKHKLRRLIFLLHDYYKFWRISLLPKNKKFQYIYKSKYWQDIKNGSVSGAGSNQISTEKVRKELTGFISQNKISSIIDIPCGDWQWMSMLDLSNINYIGYDIVEDLIISNINNYKSTNVNFEVKNLIDDKLPKSDLIIVRDMLNHLNNVDINKCITNLNNSDFRYVGITNYLITDNANNILGDKLRLGDRWRPLNLSLPPFYLNYPSLNLNDTCNLTENDKLKYLSIWSKEDFCIQKSINDYERR